MFTKSLTVACVAALFTLGCGGTEQEETAPEQAPGVESFYIFACRSTDSWVRYWYTDFDRTNEVGRETCNCGRLTLQGTKSNYYDQERTGYICGSAQ